VLPFVGFFGLMAPKPTGRNTSTAKMKKVVRFRCTVILQGFRSKNPSHPIRTSRDVNFNPSFTKSPVAMHGHCLDRLQETVLVSTQLDRHCFCRVEFLCIKIPLNYRLPRPFCWWRQRDEKPRLVHDLVNVLMSAFRLSADGPGCCFLLLILQSTSLG